MVNAVHNSQAVLEQVLSQTGQQKNQAAPAQAAPQDKVTLSPQAQKAASNGKDNDADSK